MVSLLHGFIVSLLHYFIVVVFCEVKKVTMKQSNNETIQQSNNETIQQSNNETIKLGCTISRKKFPLVFKFFPFVFFPKLSLYTEWILMLF